MKIVRPSHQVIQSPAPIQFVEQCGRVCYKSEDKITPDSAGRFVRRLVESQHESVLEHAVMSVRFICDRGVSHELVRHRLASFSQESTRYCNYGKSELTFILPPFWAEETRMYIEWLGAMQDAEERYLLMIEAGAKPEQARSVLPNSLKTELVMTANLREWRHIFRLRTSSKAHPQMRELMSPLLAEVAADYPEVFG